MAVTSGGAEEAGADVIDALRLADWRRHTFAMYREVREAASSDVAHAIWRARRDELFRTHPSTPLPPGDPLRITGLPCWPYDSRWRFELEIAPASSATNLTVSTGDGQGTHLRRLGSVELPAPLDSTLDVWWLEQYGGGLFLPLRDGTAGETTYGGGRYLLDTAKGADLGTTDRRLTIDFNFLYHPSCRYDSSWLCPLAPAGNRIAAGIEAGERM